MAWNMTRFSIYSVPVWRRTLRMWSLFWGSGSSQGGLVDRWASLLFIWFSLLGEWIFCHFVCSGSFVFIKLREYVNTISLSNSSQRWFVSPVMLTFDFIKFNLLSVPTCVHFAGCCPFIHSIPHVSYLFFPMGKIFLRKGDVTLPEIYENLFVLVCLEWTSFCSDSQSSDALIERCVFGKEVCFYFR